MLLAVQAARAYPSAVPTASQEILFTVRQGRRVDAGVPSIAGKRNAGRDRSRRSPVRLTINYTPQPHLTAYLDGQPLTALLDTGAELSFVNEDTVTYAMTLGYRPVTIDNRIHVADGTSVPISRAIQLPLTIVWKRYHQKFLVLGTLRTPILIGVDLWQQLGITLRPPNHVQRNSIHTCTAAAEHGLTTLITEEAIRLRAFLDTELDQFQQVTGPDQPITSLTRSD